jgi:hypothetical protein
LKTISTSALRQPCYCATAPNRHGGRTMEVGTVERAFQLARSGKFQDISKLEKALHREGFEAARMHLGSPRLRSQLSALLREARKE